MQLEVIIICKLSSPVYTFDDTNSQKNNSHQLNAYSETFAAKTGLYIRWHSQEV